MSWYKMERGWQEHPMFAKEKFTEREAWEWLISHAVFERTQTSILGRPVTLERGQLSYAYSYMASAWGWNKARVQRFINKLKKWYAIEAKTDTGQIVISICEYSKYQDGKAESDTGAIRKPIHERYGSDTNNKNLRTKELKNTSNEVLQKDELFADQDFSDDCETAVEVWNETLGDVLAKPRKLTPSRKSKLKRRIKDLGGIGHWRAYCERIRGSPFLTGVNEKGWTADFDFALSEEKMNRILEGKYDGKQGTKRFDSGAEAMFTGFCKADIG